MSDNQEKFETWGLLELFGHQRLAGHISDQTIGGVHFIRIDVPAVEGAEAYTRYFTQGAIYGMTPTSEQIARGLAQRLRATPISRYDLPALEAPKQPVESALVHEDDDYEDSDDEPRF